ncbi:hypothetical protein GJ744_012134 [Endocarpon pusillum]|uniref:Uncharacterized protein n=1 Tax=Endocarpon pusillum TaxID=364733 RepID=A0A8H7AFR8_9EURO|nr:hypothetical protein GJ744_012134 [Endocarpon pusillum]
MRVWLKDVEIEMIWGRLKTSHGCPGTDFAPASSAYRRYSASSGKRLRLLHDAVTSPAVASGHKCSPTTIAQSTDVTKGVEVACGDAV